MLSDELFVIVQSIIFTILDLKAWEILIMCLMMRIALALCGVGMPKMVYTMMSWCNYVLFGTHVDSGKDIKVEKPKPKFQSSYPVPVYPPKFTGPVTIPGPQQPTRK